MAPGVPVDIEIQQYSQADLKALLSQPDTAPRLVAESEGQDFLHDVMAKAHDAVKLSPDVSIPKHHAMLHVRSLITLVRGWKGDDVGAIVDEHATAEGLTLTPGERAAMIAALDPIAILMRDIRPFLEQHGLDATDLVRSMAYSWAANGYVVAPGTWLGGRLSRATQVNRDRKARRSEVVDVYHVHISPVQFIEPHPRCKRERRSGA